MQQRGARLDRLLGIEHRRQRLVLDLDAHQRLFRHVRIRRCYDGHLVADEPHALAGQHGQVAQLAPHARVRRQVGRGEHRGHAGHRRRGARVDAHDPGVRVRTAQHLPPQHTRRRVVGRVALGPGRLGAALDPRPRRADRRAEY